MSNIMEKFDHAGDPVMLYRPADPMGGPYTRRVYNIQDDNDNTYSHWKNNDGESYWRDTVLPLHHWYRICLGGVLSIPPFNSDSNLTTPIWSNSRFSNDEVLGIVEYLITNPMNEEINDSSCPDYVQHMDTRTATQSSVAGGTATQPQPQQYLQ